MQPYTVICICIWILTFTRVLETAARALGISGFSIWYGGLLILCLSPFTIYTGLGPCNAAAVCFPLYWAAYCPRVRALQAAVWTPALYAVVKMLLFAYTEKAFGLELGTATLTAELLLWCGCVLLYGARRALVTRPAR